MSRGGWVMLIGGVALLVGIALFSFGSASFIAGLSPTFATLDPGQFDNRTIEVSEVGSLLPYAVGIQNFTTGDEVTVLLLVPSGEEERRGVLEAAGPLAVSFIATTIGTHMVVIQNTATVSVEVSHSASVISLAEQNLLVGGVLVGIAGFITFIGGLIMWVITRRRERQQQTLDMQPPP